MKKLLYYGGSSRVVVVEKRLSSQPCVRRVSSQDPAGTSNGPVDSVRRRSLVEEEQDGVLTLILCPEQGSPGYVPEFF